MSLYTIIGRVSDGMILVSSQDTSSNSADTSNQQKQAKSLLKSLKPNSPSKCTVEADNYYYAYLIDQGVCYIALNEKSYPKKLIYQYLERVSKDFSESHISELHRFSRPFACVAFDPKLAKIRKEYLDPRSPANLKRLNDDLSEIQHIMRSNINDVLARGEKLENVQNMSSQLLSESKKFESGAKYINWMAKFKTYGPIAVIIIGILFILYWRFF